MRLHAGRFRAAADRLAVSVGVVLLLSFLLPLIVFHSVVVPMKAVVVIMLSTGAASPAPSLSLRVPVR